ncbi:unnamed protein product, partial [Candidula unifasciata]
NPCLSYPCLNDGTCTVVGTSHVCTCNALYTGADCSLVNNPCSSNPCRNNGVCSFSTKSPSAGTPSTPAYVCTCPEGYTGRMCD